VGLEKAIFRASRKKRRYVTEGRHVTEEDRGQTMQNGSSNTITGIEAETKRRQKKQRNETTSE
jgi:hypothetical protein